jgi:hypothetical protein
MSYATQVAEGSSPSPGICTRPSGYWLSAPDERDGGATGARPDPTDPSQHEDLPYKVELWDPAKSTVELVLAVTASGSIGYAAYHAATLEFPDRFIVLRHKGAVLARWNAPTH